MSAVPRCQTNPMPGKEKVVSTRICGETSCNQILARFLLVKSPAKGLNVLKIPFREVTPTLMKGNHRTIKEWSTHVWRRVFNRRRGSTQAFHRKLGSLAAQTRARNLPRTCGLIGDDPESRSIGTSGQ